MELTQIRQRFIPAIEEILERCRISDELVDTQQFQIYMATVWGNAVLDPGRSGITEEQLESLHDFLNEEIERVAGEGTSVTGCYEFIASKPGDEAMTRLSVTQRHREFLLHFARLILAREIEV